MHEFGAGLAAILTAIIGLAVIAVLVGQNSQTPSVIQAAGTGLAGLIGAAVSPVTGGSGGMSGAPGQIMSSLQG